MAARSREVNNHWKPFYLNCNVCNQRWWSSSSSSSINSQHHHRQLHHLQHQHRHHNQQAQVRPDSQNGDFLQRFVLPQQKTRAWFWGEDCFDFNGMKWNVKNTKAANIENFLTQILKYLMMSSMMIKNRNIFFYSDKHHICPGEARWQRIPRWVGFYLSIGCFLVMFCLLFIY